MAVQFGEGDYVALQRSWFPVLCRWHNPLGPCQGSKRVQEPLFLQIPQLVLCHD